MMQKKLIDAHFDVLKGKFHFWLHVVGASRSLCRACQSTQDFISNRHFVSSAYSSRREEETQDGRSFI